MKIFFLITLYAALGFMLYNAAGNNERPLRHETQLPSEDVLLKVSRYDNAQFAIYECGGEAVINGKPYYLEGDGYQNQFGGVQITDDSARCYIVIDTTGVTRFSFGDAHGICLP